MRRWSNSYKGQHVYVILNTENNRVKIGISEDLKTRLSGLQCASGCRLELVYSTNKLINAVQIESMVHERFANNRYIGEWFNIPAEKAVDCVRWFSEKRGRYHRDNLPFELKAQEIEKRKTQEVDEYKEKGKHTEADSINFGRYKRIKPNIYTDHLGIYFYRIEFKGGRWHVDELDKID